MERTALLESIIESVPYGVVVIARSGTLLFANHAGRSYLGLPAGEGIAVSEYLKVIPELSEQLVFPLQEPVPRFDLLAVEAGDIYLTVRGRKVPQGLALSIMEATHGKRAEQQMIGAILEAEEAQRHKLSREIHDGIGPLISAIKLNLDALQLEIKSENIRALQMAESMSELLKALSSDIRHISHNLMPDVLMKFGLVAALDNLCQHVNNSGKVQVNFNPSDNLEEIRQNMALSLYRICQELVNNAVKYAGASTIEIQLIRRSSTIVLIVEDDGVGLASPQLEDTSIIGKGMGLRNIQTRVRLLGGSFLLDSWPGQGVLATIEIPWEENREG